MKKKIKSAVISIVVIAVLLLAILIGVKNGTLDKLTKEMPTLATKQEETEKSTENVKNDSTESKPYDGIEVAEYGEEFVIRRKIDGRKYDENDRTTYNIYHVKVNDCKISRQCDFDINRLDFGLDNKKKENVENNINTKYDDIDRLQKLKDNGAIDEKEFEIEKQKILTDDSEKNTKKINVKKIKIKRWQIIVAAIVIVSVVIIWNKSMTATIPNLVGMTVQEAQETMDKLGIGNKLRISSLGSKIEVKEKQAGITRKSEEK